MAFFALKLFVNMCYIIYANGNYVTIWGPDNHHDILRNSNNTWEFDSNERYPRFYSGSTNAWVIGLKGGGFIKRGINTEGYSDIRITFDLKNGKDEPMEHDDYARFFYTINADNDTNEIRWYDDDLNVNWRSQIIKLTDNFDDNKGLFIGFENTGNQGDQDIFWIRQITLQGIPIPTNSPTNNPTHSPSISNNPTIEPTNYPSNIPTNNPTISPTYYETTGIPTAIPSVIPSKHPTSIVISNDNDSKSNASGILFGVGIAAFVLSIIILGAVYLYLRRNRKNVMNKEKYNPTAVAENIVNGETESNTVSINSNTDTQIKTDEIIASEWQKDMFDVNHITSGRVPVKHIITPKMNNNSSNNSIQIKTDELIAINVTTNQNDIHSLTQGNMDKNDWHTKE